MNDICVNVKTQEEYDWLMESLEGKGYKWMSGHLPTKYNEWMLERERTYIRLSKEKKLFRGNIHYLDEKHITLKEYKERVGIMFSKDDLEVGMLVEVKLGKKYIVMPNGVFLGSGGFVEKESYNEKFCNKYHSDYDIVKIYSYSIPYGFDWDCKYRELLWKREDTKELTVQELEDLLGYKVKIVK